MREANTYIKEYLIVISTFREEQTMDHGPSEKGHLTQAAVGEVGKATKGRSPLTQALKNPYISIMGKEDEHFRQGN